jgi:hypothetical protein
MAEPPPEAAPEPIAPIEEPVPEHAPVARPRPRLPWRTAAAPARRGRLRRRPSRPRPLELAHGAVRRVRSLVAVHVLQPLRRALAAAKAATLRLVSVTVLAGLSLIATPSPVGSDRPLPAALQKRVALVVGNSAYRYVRKLDNPRNDATDIGAALKRFGFEVIAGLDLDRAALAGKIREFTASLRGADVGVFFYAGHGLHVSGQNYLVPVDARFTGAFSPDLDLVRLDLVHRTMEREAHTNLLFFDACRDSPFSDGLSRSTGTRSAEIGRGLAVVQGGAGTLISFSTQPGTLALDGKGRNSPYSAALLRQLATSREDLGTMLIAIRNEVMEETDRKQVPWEHSALTGRFYFNPAEDAATQARGLPSRAREAFEAWSAAKDTTSLPVLEAFVTRYSDTFYAELARARAVQLRKQGIAAITVPAPAVKPGAPIDR